MDLNLCHQIMIRAFGKIQSNFYISIQRWQKGSLGNDDMNRVNGSIDLGLLPKKKSFVKHFLS